MMVASTIVPSFISSPGWSFYVVCVDSQAAEQARACVSRVAHLAASKVICTGGTSGCTDGSDVPGIVYCEEDRDTVKRWLDERGVLAAVVRPDGFVYGCARTEHELADVIASLGNALIGGTSVPPKSTVASGGLGHAEDRAIRHLLCNAGLNLADRSDPSVIFRHIGATGLPA
jgi:hypothetical protein